MGVKRRQCNSHLRNKSQVRCKVLDNQDLPHNILAENNSIILSVDNSNLGVHFSKKHNVKTR